jgi:hypothetical protein
VPTPTPTRSMILHSLQALVFCSEAFVRHKKDKMLLKSIVMHSLAGKPATQGVLMREVWSEDRNIHNVSTTARHLRRQLPTYYSSREGTDDPIRISVPLVEKEGSGYLALFSFAEGLTESRDQFVSRLRLYYGIPEHLSGPWFDGGLDLAMEAAVEECLRERLRILE